MFKSLLRFSIRDVLWLTAVIAVTVGWWLASSSNSTRIEALERELHEAKAKRWDAETELGQSELALEKFGFKFYQEIYPRRKWILVGPTGEEVKEFDGVPKWHFSGP